MKNQISEYCIKEIKKYDNIFTDIIDSIQNCFDNKLICELSQSQVDALGRLVYDIGVKEFENSELLNAINYDSSNPDIVNYWTIYDKISGIQSPELFYRRRKEVEYYFYND